MWQNDEQKMGWPARIFLMVGILISVTGLFFFVFGPKDPAYDWRRPDAIDEPPHGRIAVGDDIVLTKDQALVWPKLILVFRGLEKGRLLIEATQLEMDPEVAYPHRIDPDQTKTGFRMGGRWFRLKSWSRTRVRLELIR